MSIRIEEIKIRGQGPLRTDFTMVPGAVNLIYGKNERGKTMIVEFLLRSLFSTADNWNLRSLNLEGSVRISGIPGKDIFFPGSEQKLDSFFGHGKGLPYNLSRLLIVKGAELSFHGAEGRFVNRAVLKEYLSGTGTLDAIQGRISPTLQNASVTEGIITGHQRGELKHLHRVRADLQRMDTLFEELDRHYSGSRRRQLHDRIEFLESQKQTLIQARRYKAFQLDTDIHDQEQLLKRIPAQTVLDLHTWINEYSNLKVSISELDSKASLLEKNVQHTRWLQSAVNQLEQIEIRKPHGALLPSAAVFLLAAVTLFFLQQTFAGLGCILLGTILTSAYIFRLQQSAASTVQEDQYNRIHEEFSERFPGQSSSLASMKAELEHLQPQFYRHEQLIEQIETDHQKLIDLQHRIQKEFRSIQLPITDPTHWQQQLQDAQIQREELDNHIHTLQLSLASLDTDPNNYCTEDPGINFSRAAWDAVSQELETLQHEKTLADEQLHSLKQQFCRQTGDDISSRWETIIQHLKEQRAAAALEHHSRFAESAGSILLNQVIRDLRIREDTKIRSALQSEELAKPLWRITHTYNNYDLEGDTLFLSGPYNRFPLQALSTGAREQVLLALRLGLTTRLLSDKAFFILDDAFQHADWKRREHLMQQLIDSASQGWQVFYFTMDDHIRRLFNTSAKKVFRENYMYHELNDA